MTGHDPYAYVLERLSNVKRKGGNAVASCPCEGHRRGDRHQSLSITETPDRVLLRCHVGHDAKDICAALDIEPATLFSDYRNGTGPGSRAKETRKPYQQRADDIRYELRDRAGELVATHIRTPDKRISWVGPDGRYGLDGRSKTSLPLYGSHMLDTYDHKEPVYVVEGEHAADVAQRCSLQVLGVVTGAPACPDAEVLAVLEAFETVVLCPDNDDPGHRLMTAVSEHVPRHLMLDWASTAAGHDLADLLGGGTAAEDRRAILDGLPPSAAMTEAAQALPERCREPAGPVDRLRALGFRLASEIEVVEPQPLLLDRIAPGPAELTILFGEGGARKGTLMAHYVARLTVEDQLRVAILDYEGHVEREWVPRLDSLGADMGRILISEPRKDRRTRGPIWEAAREIAGPLQDWGVDLVVIDSIQHASLGKTVDPDTPTLFQEAAIELDRPVVPLAHVTKVGDLRYPFGSVHWDTTARVTWSLQPEGGEPVSIMTNRKNVGQRLGAFRVTFTYDPVSGLPTGVRDRDVTITAIADRITVVLLDWQGDEPPTTAEVREVVGLDGHGQLSLESVRKTLQRGEGRRWRQVGEGNRHRWALPVEELT